MIGLLGHNISYTFSPEIHKELGYDYQVFDLNEDDFKIFMEHKNFKAINVTIPYKDKVIPYLDEIDDLAKEAHAVNTIVNKDGKLYGYNTDILGLKFAFNHYDVPLKDSKVLILGTGNTSESVNKILKSFNPKEVLKVGRTTEINYDNLEKVKDFNIIVNTTPVGVYPDVYESLIDLSIFTHLDAVCDVIYNPLNTRLVSDAKENNILAFGGLMMLVAQAVFSSEYFFDKEIDKDSIVNIYHKLESSKRNIVLIGMPTAGKTTIGKKLSESLDRVLYDVDDLIVQNEERDIVDIFKEDGETYFRAVESNIIKTLSKETGCIIATGGGSILDKSNVDALKMNGTLIFIDRSLEYLISASDRPLSNDKDKLEKLYQERIDCYVSYSDYQISNNESLDETVKEIMEIIL